MTPIDIYVNRTYGQGNDNNNKTVPKVNSEFKILAAITATTVKKSATTATMDLSIGIKEPFSIMAIDSAGVCVCLSLIHI